MKIYDLRDQRECQISHLVSVVVQYHQKAAKYDINYLYETKLLKKIKWHCFGIWQNIISKVVFIRFVIAEDYYIIIIIYYYFKFGFTIYKLILKKAFYF